jgi:hypothetical protein
MYNYQIENIDIEKIYKDQINNINNKEYEKYLKYLNFFFSKYHKKDKYNKEYLDGKYILIDKNNPNKKIIITPTQFIDIHKIYFELKNYSELFLSKISSLIESKNNITEEDREQFELYKKKYMLYHDKLKSIDIINKEFYDNMAILLNTKIEKSNQLAKYYQKRILEYKNINVMITEKLKYKLIKYFKENKNKTDLEITNLKHDKNILQVKIQKEFKVTPHYLEIEHDIELGYKMGVYLCLGQSIHNLSHTDSVDISFFSNFKAIQDFVSENGKAFIFMGEGQHKIKRKAEQIACNEALKFLDSV